MGKTNSLKQSADKYNCELKALRAEVERLRDDKAVLDELSEQYRRVMAEPCSLGAKDEVHCTCVPVLRRAVEHLRMVIDKIARRYTCHGCASEPDCKCAWDEYNQNGDCLAEK